ncbi:MAG: hypothetical protein FJ034_03110 [Chloroflexi bacterium]|nr:hypothetical protein [Chloroflexota bacterium]
MRAVPARGAQYWAAQLNQDRDDVRLPISQTGPADGSALRFLANGIVLVTTKDGAGLSIRLNAPTRNSYVAELELLIPADSRSTLTWVLRRATSSAAGYAVTVNPEQQTIGLVYANASGGFETLGGARAPEIRSGRPFTLAVSVVNERIQVPVDQRTVADATDRRVLTGPAVPELGAAAGIGTIAIGGARFYEPP